MIQMKFGPYDLVPTYDREEADILQGKTLTVETEIAIKIRMCEIRDAIINTAIIGTPEERQQLLELQNFMRGKLDAFQELLDDSQEARTTQHINQG